MVISKHSDVNAFSASILQVKTCSVVLLPTLYAGCVNGILFPIFSCILLIIHIARIFISMDNSMIGLRFAGGPCGFPGLGSKLAHYL